MNRGPCSTEFAAPCAAWGSTAKQIVRDADTAVACPERNVRRRRDDDLFTKTRGPKAGPQGCTCSRNDADFCIPDLLAVHDFVQDAGGDLLVSAQVVSR